MKLSKHQKETIRKIFSGEIYDITSYLRYFDLGTEVKFDKDSIEASFNKDTLPKKYYCHNSVNRKSSNILTEADYLQKLQNGELNPSHYRESILKLSYNTGIKQEIWEGQNYTLNFYEGVYIANSFHPYRHILPHRKLHATKCLDPIPAQQSENADKPRRYKDNPSPLSSSIQTFTKGRKEYACLKKHKMYENSRIIE